MTDRDRYDVMRRRVDTQSHGATYREVHRFDRAASRLSWPWFVVKAGDWIEEHTAEIVLVGCVAGVIALLYGLTRWN